MDTLSDTERDELLDPRPSRRRWPTALTGLVAAAGGGAVAAGLYQEYLSGGGTPLRSLVTWPDWRVHLGLAVAVGVFGLVALLLGGSAVGRAALGAVVVPAVLLATVNAAVAVPALQNAIRADGWDVVGLGAWLVLGGCVAGLLAAALALGRLGARAELSPGWWAGALAVLGVAGLLYSWLVGSLGHRGSTPPTSFGYFTILTETDRDGVVTAAVVGGLGLALGAIGLAAGRRSAVAAGVSLGAAAAAAVDAVVRVYAIRPQTRVNTITGGATGLDRDGISLIVLGATAAALLLLAAVLRGRPVPVVVEEEEYDDGGHPLGFESTLGRESLYEPAPGAPGYGGTPRERGPFEPDPYDRERDADGPYGRDPYEPAPYDRETPDRAPRAPGYLPEHDPAPGAQYPLVPDERVAHHPVPPRPGISRPGED
jgi:hypothetical protein